MSEPLPPEAIHAALATKFHGNKEVMLGFLEESLSIIFGAADTHLAVDVQRKIYRVLHNRHLEETA